MRICKKCDCDLEKNKICPACTSFENKCTCERKDCYAHAQAETLEVNYDIEDYEKYPGEFD